MTLAPRIILALTLSGAMAIFAGCTSDSRTRGGHRNYAAPTAPTAPNPDAAKTTASPNPCRDKASNPCNPCGQKAARDDEAFEPWGEESQPSKSDQSTEAAGSWW